MVNPNETVGLDPNEPVGMTFWLISAAMVAALLFHGRAGSCSRQVEDVALGRSNGLRYCCDTLFTCAVSGLRRKARRSYFDTSIGF